MLFPLLLQEECKAIKVLVYNCSLKDEIVISKQLLTNPKIIELGLE
jgi:hypothetical protein